MLSVIKKKIYLTCLRKEYLKSTCKRYKDPDFECIPAGLRFPAYQAKTGCCLNVIYSGQILTLAHSQKMHIVGIILASSISTKSLFFYQQIEPDMIYL